MASLFVFHNKRYPDSSIPRLLARFFAVITSLPINAVSSCVTSFIVFIFFLGIINTCIGATGLMSCIANISSSS